jgi:hypothetical protein
VKDPNNKVRFLIYANRAIQMKTIIFTLLTFFVFENSFSQGSLRSEYERGFDLNGAISVSSYELTQRYRVDEIFVCSQEGILNLYTIILGFKKEKIYFKTIGEIINEDNFSSSEIAKKNNTFTWRECSILDCNQFGTLHEFHRNGPNSGKLYSKNKMGDLKNIEKFNCIGDKTNNKKMLGKKDFSFSKEGLEFTIIGSQAFMNPENGHVTVDFLFSKIPVEMEKDVRSRRLTFEAVCRQEAEMSQIRTIASIAYLEENEKGGGVYAEIWQLDDKFKKMSGTMDKLVHRVICK